MILEAWYTVSIVALIIGALVSNRVSVDVAMMGGLTALLVGNIFFVDDVLPVSEAVSKFGDNAIMLIGSLFVVAAGLRETGGMEFIAQRLLGRPKSVMGAQARMMIPVSIMSGFMNNTPIVAMYLPIINDWAKRIGMSPSKLYLPLSYAAIFGGRLSYIGSASNILIFGMFSKMLLDHKEGKLNDKDLSAWIDGLNIGPFADVTEFWGIALIGVPCLIVGTLYVLFTSRWLLPERRRARTSGPDARHYQVEMTVRDDAPMIGKSIEDAGLRQLPGLYLSEIERGDEVLPAVSPQEKLQAGDRLAFVGILDSVVDLRNFRGLEPATDQVRKIRGDHRTRTLVEAVVSHNSPLVHRTVRDAQFRTTYNAAIIAVHRNGEQLKQKIGDIVLRAGDTLLLETHTGFVNAYRDAGDFYLVSRVEGTRPIRHERAGLALAILALLIVLFTLTSMDKVAAAFLCAILMIGTRCVTGTEARGAVNWQVLLVIGAALGIAEAMRHTGAASAIAATVMTFNDVLPPRAMLFLTFIMAAIFAQLVTNFGAAGIMFPIAMATAQEMGVRPEPFVFTLIVAAGANFVSPAGYQTNLMVHGPGGYHFIDWVKIGTPLVILLGIVTTLLAPLFFPFSLT